MRRNSNSGPLISPPIQEFAVFGFLALAIFLVYSRVGAHRPIPFDDALYLSDNAWVLGGLTWPGLGWAFTNVDAANWHPVTWVSHMADQELFGALIGGHMIQNVVWHVVNSYLVYRLLLKLGLNRYLALALALVFACHPLNVESVAWLSQRKTQLSTFFLLAALLLYLDWRNSGRTGTLVLLLLAYLLSLMSKAMGVTLPVILFSFEILSTVGKSGSLIAQRKLWPLVWSIALRLSPLVCAALAVAIATFFAQRAGGAVVNLETMAVSSRIVNATAAIAIYIKTFFWPAELCIFYPMPSVPDWAQASQGIVLVIVGTVAAWLVHRRVPLAAFGWIWFLVSLLPVIGLVQVGGQSHADRYMYIPMLGLLISIGAMLTTVRVPQCRFPLAAGVALVSAFAIGMGCHAYAYTMYWENAETAFRRSLQVGGLSYTMTLNLAATLINLQFFKTAEPYAELSYKLWPDRPMAASTLANLYARQGKMDLAEKMFRRASQLGPENIQYQYMLGLVLTHLERGEEAEAIFQDLLKKLPSIRDWRTANHQIREVLMQKIPISSAQASDLIHVTTSEVGDTSLAVVNQLK